MASTLYKSYVYVQLPYVYQEKLTKMIAMNLFEYICVPQVVI